MTSIAGAIATLTSDEAIRVWPILRTAGIGCPTTFSPAPPLTPGIWLGPPCCT
jgi:hypothetical protein